MKYSSVRGMDDILPPESHIFNDIENNCENIFELYGYEKLIIPIVEKAEVFQRTLGEGSDIVNKEMYVFEDKKGRKLSLRPEGTASVVRCVIQHNLINKEKYSKFYYSGPMFRYERPQAGRKRMFFQIGAEFFGSKSVFADAETIYCLTDILKSLKINYTININTLGCNKCSTAYSEKVKNTLEKKEYYEKLCTDCQKRLKFNVLRIFDCKNPNCQKIFSNLPSISDMVCDDDKKHFEQLLSLLDKKQISYTHNKKLVRGLDYYTGAVYEAYVKDQNSDAIAGGGRYDNLVKNMGGPDVPSVGFAIGVDRILKYLKNYHKKANTVKVFLISVGEQSIAENFEISQKLRNQNIKTFMEFEKKSIKSQMRKANSLSVDFVLILGEDELKSGTINIKNMHTGKQDTVDKTKFLSETKNFLKLDC